MTNFDAPASGRTLTRTLVVGIALAVLAGVAGRVFERERFGATDDIASSRIEAQLYALFDARAVALEDVTTRVAASAHLIETAAHDRTVAQQLFQQLDAALEDPRTIGAGVTVYDSSSRPVAWSGRVSDVNRERLEGPRAQYVAPGAFGPALVRVEPALAPNGATPSRVGTIVAEQWLGSPQAVPGTNRLTFAGSLVPLELRTSLSPPATAGADERSFVLRSTGGGWDVEARVRMSDIADARARWRHRTAAVVWSTLALTLLFCAVPFADAWRRARSTGAALLAAASLLAVLGGARLLLHVAIGTAVPAPFESALRLLFNALLLVAIVALASDAIERWRMTRPRRRRLRAPGTAPVAGAGVAAGVVNVGMLWVYERFLQFVVSGSTLDLLRFSVNPIEPARLAMLFGLLLLHAAVIWGGAVVLRLATLGASGARARAMRRIFWLSWLAAAAAALTASGEFRTGTPPVPPAPLVVALLATAACAAVLARLHGRLRRASQASRLFTLYMALLVPALATYPSLIAFATQAKERLVSSTFGPQSASVRDELQRQLDAALASIDEIDTRQALAPLLEETPATEAVTIDRAFNVWLETALARSRLTSTIELYGARGALISRFALNLPEYAEVAHMASPCRPGRPRGWDVIEETWNILRASRSVCDSDRLLGAVVVRVMLDYGTLPFIAAASPNPRPLAPVAALDDAPGSDVEFAVYGWSRAPIYMAGSSVWRLSDDVLDRLVQSREPFWETVPRGNVAFRVYFLSDRGSIYGLGYPTITAFGHLINLAELVVLTAILFLLVLGGTVLFNAAALHPVTGRALLREVRSSFYRKLFLAFVAVAIVPAIILAIATRDRLIRQFTDSVNESAVRTATVAQRLVEDYAAQQTGGGRAFEGLDDRILMLVERAIGQDVNLFDGASLQATSERDLFASGYFARRTPADVYRSVVLEQMPTFVNVEDVDGRSFLMAAARVRAGDSERIVTVPLTLRQRELNRQRDDLDRRVWSSFVLFVLLGAGLGYWTAERIADPVNRLTRATRRIARGDLDARIAATSSDELRRLVEDFNSMAADLKRQRGELERTQRLSAWADMARQVAHDIKNPLTPIQLSAEHALRVNADRGRPLSPVLEDCITSILGQVTLLRQISAEFSSFASSPTPRPEPTDLPALIESVVEPYRTGLTGRIAIESAVEGVIPEVTIDRTLFARALTNIVENALHAMPGTGRLMVTTRMADSGTVDVVVKDTGIGMDAEALARIFQPYFSTKATGTGLGLTIAKRNVELNGGSIAVTSARGDGTTVTMSMPASPSAHRSEPGNQ